MRRHLVVIALLVGALVVGPATVAIAKKDHGHGRSDHSSSNDGDHSNNSDNRSDRSRHDGGSDQVTEDNDSDGVPNNISDDGDNRHPSGRDRSVENGGSGNQGRSQSDPDGMSNGGADKPGGTGGIDQLDQDGNNGCGNDDDFEDDNNGNCGGQQDSVTSPEVDSEPLAVLPPTEDTHQDDLRLLLEEPVPDARQQPRTVGYEEWIRPEPATAPELERDSTSSSGVLDDVVLAAAKGSNAASEAVGTLAEGILPLTGLPIGSIVFLGGFLLLFGAGMVLATRRRTI
jgi:hypothetical protein